MKDNKTLSPSGVCWCFTQHYVNSRQSSLPLVLMQVLPGSWLELRAPSTLTGTRAVRGSSNPPSRKVRASAVEVKRIGLSSRLLTKHTQEMMSGPCHLHHAHQMARRISRAAVRVGIRSGDQVDLLESQAFDLISSSYQCQHIFEIMANWSFWQQNSIDYGINVAGLTMISKSHELPLLRSRQSHPGLTDRPLTGIRKLSFNYFF